MKKISSFFILAVMLAFTSCVSTENETEPEPVEVVQQNLPEPIKEEDEEYNLAVSELNDTTVISKNTFEEDQKEILQTIENLSEIMEKQDFDAWCTYISPESLNYWRNPSNLRKAASRLRSKGLSLKTTEDYFKFVFIPSRKGRIVNKIRYISSESVKAVQVNDENTTVYYNFIKLDKKWLIDLPKID